MFVTAAQAEAKKSTRCITDCVLRASVVQCSCALMQSSGLVRHVFRLLDQALRDRRGVPWVLLENVSVSCLGNPPLWYLLSASMLWCWQHRSDFRQVNATVTVVKWHPPFSADDITVGHEQHIV